MGSAGGRVSGATDLLKSFKDGAPVTLTFRFWSGATVTYHVTRSGNTVTGTAS